MLLVLLAVHSVSTKVNAVTAGPSRGRGNGLPGELRQGQDGNMCVSQLKATLTVGSEINAELLMFNVDAEPKLEPSGLS